MAGWRGATKENTLHASSTEEQRSQPAIITKTLRAAWLLVWGFVVTGVTARCGDAPPVPPRPKPKSPAAAPIEIFRQALSFPKLRFVPLFRFELVGSSRCDDRSAQRTYSVGRARVPGEPKEEVELRPARWGQRALPAIFHSQPSMLVPHVERIRVHPC